MAVPICLLTIAVVACICCTALSIAATAVHDNVFQQQWYIQVCLCLPQWCLLIYTGHSGTGLSILATVVADDLLQEQWYPFVYAGQLVFTSHIVI